MIRARGLTGPVCLAAGLALPLATPLHAWEFSPTPVCTLSHQSAEAALSVTHDPRLAEPYAIAITRAQPWPESHGFSIRYGGARPLTIGTERHRLSNGNRTLTVSDTGFGNVLDGLEFSATATASADGLKLSFDLAGAAEPVRAFRACVAAPSA
jgi:hypothetical protein